MEVAFILKSFFAFGIAFLMTFYLVPICAKIAYSFNILDTPDGRIKKHHKPVPYLGGIAVFLGFIISLAFVLPLENKISVFLLGATILLFLGLIDDLIMIKPYQKFFGQFIATFCFLKGGLYLKEGFFLSHLWNMPISCFWILAVTNAFNLVDIMDGLATTLGICATASFLILALITQQSWVLIILLLAFLGALMAFLCYNKPPATIYLGDTGSLFLGGFLATVPFLYTWSAHNPFGYLTPVIVLAIPCLEVISLIIIRTYKGIPFYKGSPDHFALYLKNNGWSTSTILLYVSFLSGMLLIGSVAFVLGRLALWQMFLSSGIFLCIWFSLLFSKNTKTALFLRNYH